MNRQQVSSLVQIICNESSESIMEISKDFYFKLSDELANQPWDEEIFGDDYNELWDDAVCEFQAKVSSNIADNIDKLFLNLTYTRQI